MKLAGSESWTIAVDQWDQKLDLALWIRAAERIEVAAGDRVPGPLDIDPVPEPTVADGASLAEGWRFWWAALLDIPELQPPLTPELIRVLQRNGPPDFDVLADFTALQQVVRSRCREADVWHSARKRAGVEAFTAAHRAENRPGPGEEGAVVRAVEQEIGRTAAPFHLKLIFLPVQDDEIRAVDDHKFLIPDRLRGSELYERWLFGVVRALA